MKPLVAGTTHGTRNQSHPAPVRNGVKSSAVKNLRYVHVTSARASWMGWVRNPRATPSIPFPQALQRDRNVYPPPPAPIAGIATPTANAVQARPTAVVRNPHVRLRSTSAT